MRAGDQGRKFGDAVQSRGILVSNKRLSEYQHDETKSSLK